LEDHMYLAILLLTGTALAAVGSASDAPTKADIASDLPPKLKALIEQTFSPDVDERADAADGLAEMGHRAAPGVPFLIRLLPDREHGTGGRSAGVRASAALHKIGDEALSQCVAAFHRSTGRRRRAIALAIGGFRTPGAVEAVTATLGDPDPDIRRALLMSLSGSTDPQMVPPLIRALSDTDTDVRKWSTWCLERVHDPRAVQPLIESLSDKEENVREGAAKALGEQRDRRAVPPLLESLRDARESFYVRCAAAYSLGQIADPRAVEPLIAILMERQTAENLRCSAAWGLGFSGDPRAAAPLAAALKDTRESTHVRAVAVHGLANLQGQRALPLLSHAATAPAENAQVRFWAAMSVAKLSDGQVDDPAIIFPLIGYHDPTESRTAIERRMDEAGEALAKVAQRGKTEAVRAAAREMIRKRGVGPRVKLEAIMIESPR
jgi:HEAT repeat protein